MRSLYFDNAEDKALREKIDGVRDREKFRIRYYNNDTSFLRLEKKSKRNNLCFKQNALLSIEQANALLSSQFLMAHECHDPLVAELFMKMTTEGLRPKTIVQYDREAYIYSAGNVRINFDMNIRTGIYSLDFLNPESLTVQAEEGIVFEVKYDAFFPGHLHDAIQTGAQSRCAYSKYAAARMFG